MSDEEEVPFKSMKITISEEAMDMLDRLRIAGAFRSYSMTVEEIIRGLYDVAVEIAAGIREAADRNERLSPNEQAIALQRIGLRLKRFVVAFGLKRKS